MDTSTTRAKDRKELKGSFSGKGSRREASDKSMRTKNKDSRMKREKDQLHRFFEDFSKMNTSQMLEQHMKKSITPLSSDSRKGKETLFSFKGTSNDSKKRSNSQGSSGKLSKTVIYNGVGPTSTKNSRSHKGSFKGSARFY